MNKAGRITWASIAALALLAAGAGAGYAISANTNPTPSEWITEVADGEAHIVTSADLHRLAPLLGTVYWAGERDDMKFELTVMPAAITIRYLPVATDAGSGDEALTVATYRDTAGYDSLQNLDEGVAVSEATSGAIIAVPDANPLSTYFAFPGAAFQVEVFSPEAGESYELVSDGEIAPISEAGAP